MNDSRNGPAVDDPFHPDEPARDPVLGARLHALVGDPPAGSVDWPALAARITSAISVAQTPWWGWAARWERGALPLALAAGLAGAIALWNLGAPATAYATTSTDVVTAVASGAPADDAALTFARSLTNTAELSAEVPE